jgi:hypothetical protein
MVNKQDKFGTAELPQISGKILAETNRGIGAAKNVLKEVEWGDGVG